MWHCSYICLAIRRFVICLPLKVIVYFLGVVNLTFAFFYFYFSNFLEFHSGQIFVVQTNWDGEYATSRHCLLWLWSTTITTRNFVNEIIMLDIEFDYENYANGKIVKVTSTNKLPFNEINVCHLYSGRIKKVDLNLKIDKCNCIFSNRIK